ncbi:MAG: SGNH/GDSL hydrolase family protein [Myxococcota bacterium]
MISRSTLHRKSQLVRGATTVVAILASLGVTVPALASTLVQNSSWTINRSGTSTKYRIVAYGDSIYAGNNGSIWRVSKRAAPVVAGEYASEAWNADIEVKRRTKSGAVASDIYNNKIIADRSYMQQPHTRIVTFEMCGNDYLQARNDFRDQNGTCDLDGLDDALAACTYYTEAAMQAINQYATTAKAKVVSNLYYPGHDDDDRSSNCTNSQTGQSMNNQDVFLPYLVASNWRTCNLAEQYGFDCADSFAVYMGADYDSNGDGIVDSEALRYQSGESEADYVHRITVTLRDTLRDSNFKLRDATTSFDYLLSDNTHPTYTGGTIRSGLFKPTGSGSGSPKYSGSQIVDGKNPVWDVYGHDRMGHALSEFNPENP